MFWRLVKQPVAAAILGQVRGRQEERICSRGDLGIRGLVGVGVGVWVVMEVGEGFAELSEQPGAAASLGQVRRSNEKSNQHPISNRALALRSSRRLRGYHKLSVTVRIFTG